MKTLKYLGHWTLPALSIIYLASIIFAAGIDGKWRGESICTIKDSPCHDEHVLYHVSKPDGEGNMKMQMDKFVGGKAELMGTLNCVFDSSAMTITCPMQDKEWKFKIAGTKMDGTLTLGDGRLYRRISVTKDQ